MKPLLENPELLTALLTVVTLVITTVGGIVTRYVMKRTGNEEVADVLGRFVAELRAAVAEVGQTYVDAIRIERPLTEEEKREAKRRAMEAAKRNMGAVGIERLKRVLGTDSLEDYAATHLEALVRDAKPKPIVNLSGLSSVLVMLFAGALLLGCARPPSSATLADGIEAGVSASRGAVDRAAVRLLKWNSVAEAAIEAAATDDASLKAGLARLDQVRQPVEAAFAAFDAAVATVEPIIPLLRKGKVDVIEAIAAAAQVYRAADHLRTALQAIGVK